MLKVSPGDKSQFSLLIIQLNIIDIGFNKEYLGFKRGVMAVDERLAVDLMDTAWMQRQVKCRAARSIHLYLSGQSLEVAAVQTMTKVECYRGLDDYGRRSRPAMPTLSPEQRDSETEVELGYDLERAQAEAQRLPEPRRLGPPG